MILRQAVLGHVADPDTVVIFQGQTAVDIVDIAESNVFRTPATSYIILRSCQKRPLVEMLMVYMPNRKHKEVERSLDNARRKQRGRPAVR